MGTEGEVSFKRLTAILVAGVVASVACPLSGASTATSSQQSRSYPLPSDGWKPGEAAMEAVSPRAISRHAHSIGNVHV